jgi:hypothetical protein
VSASRRILLISGITLALWGMAFGLYYALFAEHQALDKIGGALSQGFTNAAGGDLIASRMSLQNYADAQFDYVRSVDVHSHWIGLAMLLIVFGFSFDRLKFDESRKLVLAWLLTIGSASFPAGVILQTLDRGVIPQSIAALGVVLVIFALGAIAIGFARSEKKQ